MLNINILTCSMLRYSTHASNHEPLLHCILISDEDTYLNTTSYSFYFIFHSILCIYTITVTLLKSGCIRVLHACYDNSV